LDAEGGGGEEERHQADCRSAHAFNRSSRGWPPQRARCPLRSTQPGILPVPIVGNWPRSNCRNCGVRGTPDAVEQKPFVPGEIFCQCREDRAKRPIDLVLAAARWRCSMRVVLAQPRGYCAGVVRAIDIVERSLEKFGAP